MTRLLTLLAMVTALLPLAAATQTADPLPAPQGQVILTVTGAIRNHNVGDALVFDLPMLESMRAVDFETSTLWTSGVSRFTGVPLADVVAAAGVSSGTLQAHAINDYSVEIAIDSIGPDVPIIAYRMDGKPMSRRDKGPLWIIYPYDSDDKYRSETVYALSIWQLDRIEVRK